jgi:predicted nucleotidyltransferase
VTTIASKSKNSYNIYEEQMETLLRKRRKVLCRKHYNKAYRMLREAIDFLYREGATEVYLFGSITNPDAFTEHSDIDIAVKGISEDKHLTVEGRLAEFLGNYEYDIIFLEEEENIRKEIRDKIKREAVLWNP